MTIIALAGGSYIFLGVIGLLLAGVIFGYFTYEGSGINPHPTGGGDAPGASEASSASGKGRTGDEHFDDDANGGGAFESHGTQ